MNAEIPKRLDSRKPREKGEGSWREKKRGNCIRG